MKRFIFPIALTAAVALAYGQATWQSVTVSPNPTILNIPGTVSNNVASAGLLAVDATKTNGVAATFGHVTNALGYLPATNSALGNYVLKAGDTMTGALSLTNSSTINGELIQGSVRERLLTTNALYTTGINIIGIVKNPACSMGSTQFVVWIDKGAKVNISTRYLATGTKVNTQLTNAVPSSDEHHVAAIALDSAGYIHLAYGMHATALRYCKSTAPLVTTFGSTTSMVGTHETQVSYPMFSTDPIYNDLYFTFRDGASGNGDQYFYHYNTNSTSWEAATGTGSGGIILNGKTTPVSAYLNGLPKWDTSGTNLWWNWTWYDGANVYSNQFVMKWDKITFKTFAGAAQTIPVTTANITGVYAMTTQPGTQNDFAVDGSNNIVIAYPRNDASGNSQIWALESSTGAFIERQITFNEGIGNWIPPGVAVFPFRGANYIVYAAQYQWNNRGLRVLRSTDYFASASESYVSQHYNPNWAFSYDPYRFRSGVLSFMFMDADDATYGYSYLQTSSNPNLGYLSIIDWIPAVGSEAGSGYPSDLVGLNQVYSRWVSAGTITAGTGTTIANSVQAAQDVTSGASRYIYNGTRTGFASPDNNTFQIGPWTGTNIALAFGSQARIKAYSTTPVVRNSGDTADAPIQSSWHILSSTTNTPTGAQCGTNGCVMWCSNAVVYVTTSTDGSAVSTKQIAP